MEYTRDQLIAGAKRAYESGNESMARELSERAMRMDQQSASENEELFGSTTSSSLLGDGAANSALIGVGKGFSNVIEGATDAYHRLAGNEDALDRVNKRADYGDSAFSRDFEGDYWAKGGEIAGEIGATLPLAGAAGAAFRGASVGKAALGAATLEGAAAEGLTQRGGLQERGAAAGMGAAFGAGGDLVMKGAGRIGRRYVGKKKHLPDIEAERRVLEEEADELQRIAREDGGVDIDRVDATGLGLYEREAVRNTEEGAARLARENQQMVDKARSFVDTDLRDANSISQAKTAASQEVWGGLQSKRLESEEAVEEAWETWRKSIGDDPLDDIYISGLRNKINEAKDGMLIADRETVEAPLEKILKKFGLDSEKPLHTMTGGDLGKIRQEINRFARKATSPTDKRAFEVIKETIEDHVVGSPFGQISRSGETVKLGQAANDLTKQHYATWGDKEFLGKLTRSGIDGEEFAKNPATEFSRMLQPRNRQELLKLKENVDFYGTPEMKKQFQVLQDMPILEALDASINKASGELNKSTFRKAVNRLDPDVQKALWGGEKADALHRAMKAWDLQGRKPVQGSGAINTSNTAGMSHHFMQALSRVAAGSGILGSRVGQFVLGIPAATAFVRDYAAKNVAKGDLARLAAGELPEAAARRLEKEATEEMLRRAGIPELVKYDNLWGNVMRTSLREAADGLVRNSVSEEENQ